MTEEEFMKAIIDLKVKTLLLEFEIRILKDKLQRQWSTWSEIEKSMWITQVEFKQIELTATEFLLAELKKESDNESR